MPRFDGHEHTDEAFEAAFTMLQSARKLRHLQFGLPENNQFLSRESTVRILRNTYPSLTGLSLLGVELDATAWLEFLRSHKETLKNLVLSNVVYQAIDEGEASFRLWRRLIEASRKILTFKSAVLSLAMWGTDDDGEVSAWDLSEFKNQDLALLLIGWQDDLGPGSGTEPTPDMETDDEEIAQGVAVEAEADEAETFLQLD